MSDTPSPLEDLERLKAERDAAQAAYCDDALNRAAEGRFHEAQRELGIAIWTHFPWLLTQAREAAEMRDEIKHYDAARLWLNDQLEIIRRRGAAGDTYRQLVSGISDRLGAAIDSARKDHT